MKYSEKIKENEIKYKRRLNKQKDRFCSMERLNVIKIEFAKYLYIFSLGSIKIAAVFSGNIFIFFCSRVHLQ